ncbi:MAG: hypothetical protein SNG81_04235 [Rikenellaceae bacterium]
MKGSFSKFLDSKKQVDDDKVVAVSATVVVLIIVLIGILKFLDVETPYSKEIIFYGLLPCWVLIYIIRAIILLDRDN